jgi:hypothetical protein
MPHQRVASRHYQGPIDRVFVSLREVHDVDFFIDEYLRTRRLPLDDAHRRRVGERLESFVGRVPYLWGDLSAFLDCGEPFGLTLVDYRYAT